MIIDFSIKEWQPNYLAFKDAGNVPPALTQLSTTPEPHTALGRRYWNPLGECFMYVVCDASRGNPVVADEGETSIEIPVGSCYVEDLGSTSATISTNRPLYNVFTRTEFGDDPIYYNAVALYPFVSIIPANSTVLTVAWGLVKLLPCNSTAGV